MSAPEDTPKSSAAAASTGTDSSNRAGDAATTGLAPFRARLDFLDGEILRLLGERFDVCRQVAHHKREHDIAMMQPQRVVEVRERYMRRGGEAALPADFAAALFELLIGATCKMEDELIAQPAAAGDGSAE
ncbi:MAG TPA: chorismate mutase [Solirubrobacteraceae bacterium]|jgi:chorismate mutase|nr:chorismate mutase [Solirubrobacteraceae bacterium]